MNIEKIEKPDMVSVQKLQIGDFFEFAQELFIIINKGYENTTALKLRNQQTFIFVKDDLVIPIPSNHINIRYYH